MYDTRIECLILPLPESEVQILIEPAEISAIRAGKAMDMDVFLTLTCVGNTSRFPT